MYFCLFLYLSLSISLSFTVSLSLSLLPSPSYRIFTGTPLIETFSFFLPQSLRLSFSFSLPRFRSLFSLSMTVYVSLFHNFAVYIFPSFSIIIVSGAKVRRLRVLWGGLLCNSINSLLIVTHEIYKLLL